jgi:UDP-N-acetylglucosamine--N-acetylmuramyl-(pentapeptide) pyrophosphoryl-undecaprenol N-acetylglucosamine transferase
MAGLYASSALLLCRAGATTVAEIAAAGVPAVLVPWSGAAGDQQAANARALAEAGGAFVVDDADCSVTHVEPLLAELLASPARLRAMADAARALGRVDAAARVSALVEETARAA